MSLRINEMYFAIELETGNIIKIYSDVVILEDNNGSEIARLLPSTIGAIYEYISTNFGTGILDE